MSKFDFGVFTSDCDGFFAVNKGMFIREQADKLFVQECDLPLERAKISTGYVFYGIGYNEDNEKVSGYWCNERPKGRHPVECWLYRYSL